MTYQRKFQSDHPEPLKPDRGTARALEQIDQAHATCEWFRDRQAAIKRLLADDRICTANQLQPKEPRR